MISEPKSYVGKFAVVTRSKTFIKGEIHKILGVSQSNFFVDIAGSEQVIPILKYDKPWVDWFNSAEEAEANLPIIEKRRQAEEELDDLNGQTDLMAHKILDSLDKDLTESHDEIRADFESKSNSDASRYEAEHLKLARSFSLDERLALKVIGDAKLYRKHLFTRGRFAGEHETVLLFEDAMKVSGLHPSVFLDSVNKFIKNDLLVCWDEPGTFIDKLRGIKGRSYIRINAAALGVLVEIIKPHNALS